MIKAKQIETLLMGRVRRAAHYALEAVAEEVNARETPRGRAERLAESARAGDWVDAVRNHALLVRSAGEAAVRR